MTGVASPSLSVLLPSDTELNTAYIVTSAIIIAAAAQRHMIMNFLLLSEKFFISVTSFRAD